MQSENVAQKRPKYIQFRSRCFKKKLCRNCPSMQPISRCVNQFFTYQVAIIVTEEELVLVKCNFFELAVDPANDLWMQRRQLSPGCKGCRQHQVLEHSQIVFWTPVWSQNMWYDQNTKRALLNGTESLTKSTVLWRKSTFCEQNHRKKHKFNRVQNQFHWVFKYFLDCLSRKR